MDLTKEEKTRFNAIFKDLQGKTNATDKQLVISALSKEDLEKFTFHLYNEAYKYSEDLKSGGYSPANRLQVTKEQLKAISPYLVTAKIKNIYSELGENSTEDEIKGKVRSEFKIQDGEVDDQKLVDLAKALSFKIPLHLR